MKVSKIKRIIQEEIQNVSPKSQINEGLMGSLYSMVIKKLSKKAYKDLQSDPKYVDAIKKLKTSEDELKQATKDLHDLGVEVPDYMKIKW